VKPRKSLGQHFLVDEQVVARIVQESGVTSGDTVLEIGPGTGDLTERLAHAARRVVAVEIDETLAAAVRRRLSAAENVAVVCADFLDHSPEELLAEGGAAPPYVVVANIPYYITGLILRRLLDADHRPNRITLMIQKEVAASIVAPPGRMSLLGASVQFFGDAQLLFPVPRSAFHPAPKVDSAVVRIDLRDQPAVTVPDEAAFFNVVRAGFSQPRKQLHNALAARLWLPPDSAPELLRSAGIDPARRAQSLSLEEWARVSAAVTAVRAAAKQTGDDSISDTRGDDAARG